jgi:dienelactone hydrolase
MKGKNYMKTILLLSVLIYTAGMATAGTYRSAAHLSVASDTLKPVIPPHLDTTAVSPQQIAEAQILADKFLQRDYASFMEKFDSTMKSALPLDKLKEARESLNQRLGAFQQQLGIRGEKYQQYDIVYVTWQFEAMTIDFKLVLNPSGQISGIFFVPVQSAAAPYAPPAYVKPESFKEQEITVGSGEWALPGTLTMPAGSGPFPAVVLIHGSGPNDRDETIGPNKPFRDLAWGLASKGIAVLRYEKRTKQHAIKFTKDIMAKLTVKEETIDDALAAVALLRQTKGIDTAKIFVLGHSLGGMLLPRIAEADKKIAGLVIMAGPTRPLEDITLDQIKYISGLDGTVSGQEQTYLDTLSAQVTRVKSSSLSPLTPASALPLGLPANYWLDLRNYHPAAVAQKLKQPMLILQGGRDYQVTAQDFEGWKSALSSHSNVQLKLYPDLNHLFISGEGKSTPAEYGTTGHVAGQVISDIAKWILK